MQNSKPKQPNPYQSAIKKEQDEVVLSYMPALKAMAYRLKERLPANIDVNDLVSMGTIEMIKLSKTYNKEQNDSFWGYAKKRVYGSMLDYLRSLDVLSRTDRKLLKEINLLIDSYFNEHEYEPDDEYLANALSVDLQKIREARSAGAIASVLSLDERVDIQSEHNTEEFVIRSELLERIENVLNEFSQRDQLVMQLYYYEELSLREIAEILNISEGRVSQIHARLLKKIRENLEVNG
ncbi:RNA polymerase sigma factor FliA [Campylobacter majalis]|uniref:RNA polymerase sigma factor FliA n=1 Tax=Campylobacter majalis TaxID=2790656 RepID=A0ABM8Q4R4_9BACT|nr:RNA polymerase sigma factor FliA [Campylobacter majalis]CAD7287825.1 RNA polymerase sigma factor FliA [Campylobacter majalis]